MNPMISLGQKYTLAEYMILFGADNRPPMLDKDLYDSWKSQMELYMQNREHERMILESFKHGPLIWPMVEENGMIRTKKYAELSVAEKIQADCDMKATNIILQGLPTDIYSLERECKLYDAFDNFTHIMGESLHTYYLRFTQLITDMNIYKMKMEQFQVNTKFLNSLPPEWSFAIPVFSPGDDPIAYLNKAMAFLTDGRQGRNYSGTTYKGNATSSRGNTTSGQARVVKCYNCQGERHMARQCTQPKRLRNAVWYKEKAMLAEAQEVGQILDEEQLAFLTDLGIPAGQAQTIISHNASFQSKDLHTYDSDYDDLSTAQAILMANISNYGFDIISEDFKQSPVMDYTNNEISSDSNIIPYSQYLQEIQQATVQDTNLQAQQDSMIYL
ncbi:retrovirus-related pol polyprotein from transposon TNT 1-94 [Tanacetum coccineum]